MNHAESVSLRHHSAPRSTPKGRLSLSAVVGLAMLSLAGPTSAAERREFPVDGQVLELSVPPGYSDPAAGGAVKEAGGKRYILAMVPEVFAPGSASVAELANMPSGKVRQAAPSECLSAPTLRTRASAPAGGSAVELLYWCPSSAKKPGTSQALAMRTSAAEATTADGWIRMDMVVLSVEGPESKTPPGSKAAAEAEAALAEAVRELDAFGFSARQVELKAARPDVFSALVAAPELKEIKVRIGACAAGDALGSCVSEKAGRPVFELDARKDPKLGDLEKGLAAAVAGYGKASKLPMKATLEGWGTPTLRLSVKALDGSGEVVVVEMKLGADRSVSFGLGADSSCKKVERRFGGC